MQNLTNKYDLPFEVVKALTTNRYAGDSAERKSDYSASTIVAPIQQTILKRRYPDCETGDVIDRLWSMFGSIAHSLLEEHGADDSINEERFYAEVLGKTISGQIDNYNSGIVTDYKTTSAFKVTKKSYEEWEKQLNIYAWLCRQNNLPVTNIRIIAIIRDWSERDASNPNYPQSPIVVIPITLWDEVTQEAFITERVTILSINDNLPDDELEPCTPEEMWQSPDVWALMKKGGKRAVKLFNSKGEAESTICGYTDYALEDKDNPYEIVKRCGERRRCSRYCVASSVCVQFKNYIESQEAPTE